MFHYYLTYEGLLLDVLNEPDFCKPASIILPMRDCYFMDIICGISTCFYYLTYEGLLHFCITHLHGQLDDYYLTYEGLLLVRPASALKNMRLLSYL